MMNTPDIHDLRRAHYVLENEAESARMTRGHELGAGGPNGSVGEALLRVAAWLAQVIMEKNIENAGR